LEINRLEIFLNISNQKHHSYSPGSLPPLMYGTSLTEV